MAQELRCTSSNTSRFSFRGRLIRFAERLCNCMQRRIFKILRHTSEPNWTFHSSTFLIYCMFQIDKDLRTWTRSCWMQKPTSWWSWCTYLLQSISSPSDLGVQRFRCSHSQIEPASFRKVTNSWASSLNGDQAKRLKGSHQLTRGMSKSTNSGPSFAVWLQAHCVTEEVGQATTIAFLLRYTQYQAALYTTLHSKIFKKAIGI